jgi:hypothetical protein
MGRRKATRNEPSERNRGLRAVKEKTRLLSEEKATAYCANKCQP